MKVLIADDSLYTTTLLKMLFLKLNLEVLDSVSDGDHVIHAIETLKPDLITLDNNMPNVRGIEILREMRRTGNNTDVIFISAAGQNLSLIHI